MARLGGFETPVGLALSPDERTLYVASETARGLGGGDGACPGSGGGARHPPGGLAAVALDRLRSDASHLLRGVAAAGCDPVRVAAGPDGRVWVTAREDGALLGFDVTALGPDRRARPASRTRVGADPVGVALAADGARAWVALSARFGGRPEVAEVDLSAKPPAVATRGRVSGGFPRDLRMLPDGRTPVVALFDGQAVQIGAAPR